jgi:hypothetical protein
LVELTIDPERVFLFLKRGGDPVKELIEHIIQAMVDNPEQIKIAKIAGDNTTVYELSVAKNDIGKVIGKRGRNVSALRTILTAASASAQKGRTILEIVE